MFPVLQNLELKLSNIAPRRKLTHVGLILITDWFVLQHGLSFFHASITSTLMHANSRKRS